MAIRVVQTRSHLDGFMARVCECPMTALANTRRRGKRARAPPRARDTERESREFCVKYVVRLSGEERDRPEKVSASRISILSVLG
jgi:hypothetical protein